MVLQSQQVVVYRMVDDAGREYALSRFILPKDVLIALNDGRFPQCLKELMSITHGCLRPVIDGGLDPVDRSPWLATYWWDGKTLKDRIQDKELSESDILRIEEHAKSVVTGVGQFAAFLNFDPSKIVAVKGATGDVVETFTVDLYQWFLSWATGRPPAPDREPNRQVAGLISNLRKALARPHPTPSSPAIPPRTTASITAASPSGSLVPIGTSSLASGTTSTVPQRATQQGAVPGQVAQSADPLAAYRKQVTTGQKVGVAAAVVFIVLAVGGIGFMVLKDGERQQSVAGNNLVEDTDVPTDRFSGSGKGSILEIISDEVEGQDTSPVVPQIAGKTPSKAMVIEEGDGPISGEEDVTPPEIAEVTPAPVEEVVPVEEVPAVVATPGERPSLGNMVELYSSEEIDLSTHLTKWVILTGNVKATGNLIEFDGPSGLQVKIAPGAGAPSVKKGDFIEIVGWVDPNGGTPVILMQKTDDLVILQESTSEEGNSVYGVTDQDRLKDLTGSTVTVVARVVALDDDKNDEDEVSRLHLVFDEAGNGFAASVLLAESEDNIDLPFLEQFVDEQVRVEGTVAMLGTSPELLIEVRRKAQISKSE